MQMQSTLFRMILTSLTLLSASLAAPANILFFGDSLTAGYGLDTPDLAFPGLIQKKINAEKLPYRTLNAGLSGDTSAGGLRRIDWVLREPIALFVLELGANDGLRGLSLTATEANLQAIIDRVRTRQPAAQIILVGMQLPPNLGGDYANNFRELFPRLAEKNRLNLIPYLLADVGGIASLNQADGIHPSAAGQAIVAETTWKTLRPLLTEPVKGP
jgi:acyl-CoA thioesterase-1